MTQRELKKVLNAHKKWLDGTDLNGRAYLRGADLRGANLIGANLRGANLRCANLIGADLRYADLRYADLSGADLSGADLNRADLNRADLNRADLNRADLRYANLSGADLSGAEGLLSTIEYLNANFEKTADGYIAYKTFSSQYKPPEKWVIQPGSVITENVNFDRCCNCGCGINVAPLDWVRIEYGNSGHDIWKVLIRFEWLVGACVPYHTDGKIRCERVELLEIVK